MSRTAGFFGEFPKKDLDPREGYPSVAQGPYVNHIGGGQNYVPLLGPLILGAVV